MSAGSSRPRPTLFGDLPEDELEPIVGGLERRRFPAGTTVIAEGDPPQEIYVIESGSADVFVADRHGVEHRLTRIRPGATVGETAMLLGQPAPATVRAADDLDVIAIGGAEFERLAARFPRVYRNLGAILADRLARADRRAVIERTGTLAVLRDAGGPPLLGYALAASVAWHTRAPTVLVYLDPEPPPELDISARGLTTALVQRDGGKARAEILHAAGARGFSSPSLPLSLHDLFLRYENVLVQTKGEPPDVSGARTVVLGGPDARPESSDELVLRAWARAPQRLGADATNAVPIPELADDEEAAVHQGALPVRGAAGRSLGWVARDLTGTRVGLALGAGSLRVFAHVGIIRALTRAGTPIDYVAGTSAGAIVAAAYALGMSPDQMLATLDSGSGQVFRPTVPVKSFLSSRGVARFMASVTRGRRIEDLDMPLALVGADLVTGREVVFRHGDLALAVLASVSIPGIYPAQPIGPYAIVDGGVLNPVPASVVAEMGAGRVIAVKLGTPAVPPDADATAVRGEHPTPSAVAVMMRAIELMQNTISVATSAPTVFIEPEFEDLPGAKMRNFREGRRYVAAGEAAAEAAMPRLAAALPWLRP